MKRAIALIVMVSLPGCGDMSVQPKQKTYRPLVGPAKTPSNVVAFLEKPEPAPPVTLSLLEQIGRAHV